MEETLFAIVGVISIAAAVGMLWSKNAIHSALYLILNFLCVAFLYVMLDASFLALVQVAVYAGAIMVLFLFVIMLLGAEKLGLSETLAWQKPLAILLGIILAVEAVYVLFFKAAPAIPAAVLPDGFGSPSSIGTDLFQSYLLPFEVTSVLLLVAMIGAIVLTRRRSSNKG